MLGFIIRNLGVKGLLIKLEGFKKEREWLRVKVRRAMKFKLSKGSLGVLLSRLEGFQRPKVRLEQYPTEPEIAADMLWNAFLMGDIEGKVIVDLGCGTGVLGIGALILGARRVSFVDFDSEALEIAKRNLLKAKSESSFRGVAEFMLSDVKDLELKGEVVVQNPPFGVKVRHSDRQFLGKAMEIAPIIHSLHKSESNRFLSSFCSDNRFDITNQKQYDFPLKRTMQFHKKRIHRIKVSWYRLEKR